MEEVEQILQTRLERLEAGETLDKITAGLSEEESELLYLAAQIRTIPKPARDTAIIQSQYRQVIQAAKQNFKPTPLQLTLKWLLPVGLTLVLFAALAGFFRGMSGLTNRGMEQVASSRGEPTNVLPTLPGGLTPTIEQIPLPTQASNPQVASLQSVHGVVQVQNPDGSWATVQTAEIRAGQMFRTMSLSSAQLSFFDGSVVSLGANTSVTVESIHAQIDGPRQISLFQPYGETSHNVAPSSAENSSYIVHTPSATGEAKGTTFQVSVIADEGSSFSVVEGQVDVTGQQNTVSLTYGQITSIDTNGDPSEPVFWVDAQGEVTQTGELWIIGGIYYQTHAGTLFLGNPGVSDLVSVRGRLLDDGTQLADRIESLSHSFGNHFKMTGVLEGMGDTTWMVSGQEIQINEGTKIDEGVEEGKLVLARGVVQENGVLLAKDISLLQGETHFEFTGLVEQVDGSIWTISDKAITTDQSTEIGGDPQDGDLVHVEGLILSNGTWLAQKIEKTTETDHFEFIGTVGAKGPWVVNGISLDANQLLRTSSGVEIGSQVHVEGAVLEDGTWLASEIQLVDGPEYIVFVGIVDSKDPLVVNGIELDVTNAEIIGNITKGKLVQVTVQVQDSEWLVEKVELLEKSHFNGCVQFVDVVESISEDGIVLQNGMEIPWEVITEDSDDLSIALGGEVVTVRLCFSPQQEIIYAEIILYDGSAPTPVPTPIIEDKVTICHIPGGDLSKANTITVDSSAASAHLAHGDTLGACPESPGEEGTSQDIKDEKKNENSDKGDKGKKDD